MSSEGCFKSAVHLILVTETSDRDTRSLQTRPAGSVSVWQTDLSTAVKLRHYRPATCLDTRGPVLYVSRVEEGAPPRGLNAQRETRS